LACPHSSFARFSATSSPPARFLPPFAAAKAIYRCPSSLFAPTQPAPQLGRLPAPLAFRVSSPNPIARQRMRTTVLHYAARRMRFYFKRHRRDNLGLSASRIGAASAAAVAPAAGLEAPGAGARDRVRRDRYRALPRSLRPQFGADHAAGGGIEFTTAW